MGNPPRRATRALQERGRSHVLQRPRQPPAPAQPGGFLPLRALAEQEGRLALGAACWRTPLELVCRCWLRGRRGATSAPEPGLKPSCVRGSVVRHVPDFQSPGDSEVRCCISRSEGGGRGLPGSAEKQTVDSSLVGKIQWTLAKKGGGKKNTKQSRCSSCWRRAWHAVCSGSERKSVLARSLSLTVAGSGCRGEEY